MTGICADANYVRIRTAHLERCSPPLEELSTLPATCLPDHPSPSYAGGCCVRMRSLALSICRAAALIESLSPGFGAAAGARATCAVPLYRFATGVRVAEGIRADWARKALACGRARRKAVSLRRTCALRTPFLRGRHVSWTWLYAVAACMGAFPPPGRRHVRDGTLCGGSIMKNGNTRCRYNAIMLYARALERRVGVPGGAAPLRLRRGRAGAKITCIWAETSNVLPPAAAYFACLGAAAAFTRHHIMPAGTSVLFHAARLRLRPVFTAHGGLEHACLPCPPGVLPLPPSGLGSVPLKRHRCAWRGIHYLLLYPAFVFFHMFAAA